MILKTFWIAEGKLEGKPDEEGAMLMPSSKIDSDLLESQGYQFGEWLLEQSSTPFLKGLQRLLDEAEIAKKVGLGY